MMNDPGHDTPASIAEALSWEVSTLSFASPVSYVYNPLEYAWLNHRGYLETYGTGPKRTLFVGMNPGPWGMAQTGVPFGEVSIVSEWLGLSSPIGKPAREHSARPVTGLDCPRSEVSGRRLWKLFSERSASAEAFFAETMVLNYCPLLFLEESGRNKTPDKLPSREREELFAPCDRALIRYLHYYRPEFVVGVGAFAAGRLRHAMNADRRADAGSGESRTELSAGVVSPRVVQVLHPSPANPRANRDWAGEATRTLVDAGVWHRVAAGQESGPVRE